jgi:hypothetical protein
LIQHDLKEHHTLLEELAALHNASKYHTAAHHLLLLQPNATVNNALTLHRQDTDAQIHQDKELRYTQLQTASSPSNC